MENQAQYRILEYRHSQFSTETLAIGMLYIQPIEDDVFVFRHISSASRVANFYHNHESHFLSNTFRIVNRKVAAVNTRFKENILLSDIVNLNEIVNSEILPTNSGALSFSNPIQFRFENKELGIEKITAKLLGHHEQQNLTSKINA